MESNLHDLTAGYALDALDDDERAAFEEHLRGCERCRAELADLAETASQLAFAAPAAAPPPALRDRILEEARGGGRVIEFPVHRRRLTFALGGVAAAAAAVAIGVGVWATTLSNELDEQRQALDVLADPDARSTELDGASGRLVVDDEGQAALVLRDVDPAPGGKTYEAWVIAGDAAPKPAGLFRGDDDRDLVLLTRRVPPGAQVAVTIEREGGVDAPTQVPIFRARA